MKKTTAILLTLIALLAIVTGLRGLQEPTGERGVIVVNARDASAHPPPAGIASTSVRIAADDTVTSDDLRPNDGNAPAPIFQKPQIYK